MHTTHWDGRSMYFTMIFKLRIGRSTQLRMYLVASVIFKWRIFFLINSLKFDLNAVISNCNTVAESTVIYRPFLMSKWIERNTHYKRNG